MARRDFLSLYWIISGYKPLWGRPGLLRLIPLLELIPQQVLLLVLWKSKIIGTLGQYKLLSCVRYSRKAYLPIQRPHRVCSAATLYVFASWQNGRRSSLRQKVLLQKHEKTRYRISFAALFSKHFILTVVYCFTIATDVYYLIYHKIGSWLCVQLRFEVHVNASNWGWRAREL